MNLQEKLRFYMSLSKILKLYSGTLPLTITNATADNAKDYKLYGESKQEYITIDGVQYKVPSGYTVLDYIESTGAQYIDTGINASNGLSVETDMQWTDTTSTQHVFGGRIDTYHRFGVAIYTSKWDLTIGSDLFTTTAVTSDKTNIKFNTSSSGASLSIDDTEIKTTTTTVSQTINMWLFANNNNGSINLPASLKMYNCKIYDSSNVLVRNYIPMKNSSNVAGMYDFVSNTFYTSATSTEFIAGNEAPCPTQPIDVVSVGDKTVNLFDKATYGTSCNGSLETTGSIQISGTSGTFKFPCEPNTQYWIGFLDELGTTMFRVATTETEFTDTQLLTLDHYIGATKNYTFTTNANAHWMYLQTNLAKFNDVKDVLMLVKGSTAPSSYIPYGYQIPVKVNGTTQQTIYLSAPLRKIDSYSDYIDYENQQVVRNIGVKVLDGTEAWGWTSVRNALSITDALVNTSAINYTALCNDYLGYVGTTSISSMSDNSCKINASSNTLLLKDATHSTDATTWTTYLASQYSAGTPVIVYYPLATATTESITIPAIAMVQGTNIVTTGTTVTPSSASFNVWTE